MQILPATQNPSLAVVCCVHGNETFGLDVFEHFRSQHDRYPRLTLILANEEAVAAEKRFVDTDLNRCFPGDADGKAEERLAARLLPHVQASTLLLDIHTTTSDLRLTPIIASLDKGTRSILRHVDSPEVVMMHSPLADHSLIAHAPAGVSLEFGEAYAHGGPGALMQVVRLVDNLLDGATAPARPRTLYHVTGTVPRDAAAPTDLINFQYSPALQAYPFLTYEQNYPTIIAMAASTKEEMII